ncbi:hypothetical protein F442_08025, partial [Phytophthora nicotianae P10297]
MCSSWEKDMKWLCVSWSSKQVDDVELFGEETTGNIDRKGGREKGCADDILHKYKTAALQTAFVLPSGAFSLDISKVVGAVARDCFLSDTVLLMCLQVMCDM